MCDACWLGVCACVCVLCWSVLVRVAFWESRTYTTLGTLEGTSLVYVIRVLPGVNPGRHPTVWAVKPMWLSMHGRRGAVFLLRCPGGICREV